MDSSASLKTLNIIISNLHFRARAPPRCFFRSAQVNRSMRFSPGSTTFSSALSSLQKRATLCSLPNVVGEAIDKNPPNKLLQVVLVHPQIPGNTGCIARTCAASAVGLHLVGPLGFQVDDTKLKRAGLDYWPYVVVKVHNSWAEFRNYFIQQNGDKRLLAFTKRGTSIHSEFTYRRGDWLVFGSETSGLPEEALLDCKDEEIGGGTIRLPMVDTYVRCLNLSVSVGIGLYEAARQINYEQLRSCDETSNNEQFDWKNIQSEFVIDDVYEHINAPQWVDFSSAPLIDLTQDHLWFCRPECNHPRTAEDFLKQLPSANVMKSSSCHEIRDCNLNRRRVLKKDSKCESDCENHNPNPSTSCKKHKVSSKNLFAAGEWPITEMYNEFKRKLTFRTKAEEKKNLSLLHSIDEDDNNIDETKNIPPCVELKNAVMGTKDAGRRIKFLRSSRTTAMKMGDEGILQEVKEEPINKKKVVNSLE